MKYLNCFFLLIASLTSYQHVSAECGSSSETPAQNQDSYFSSFSKKVKYEVSLGYTKMGQNDWWTKIEPYNIYLGALPLMNEGHLEKIAELGVTGVLSMVEDFELEAGWVNVPVTPLDWDKAGINVEHIKAVDFCPLTHAEIERGVAYLAVMLEQGQKVYVHCKAGRGRSATIVVAYLMQYQLLSFDEALSFVKDQRPQINLNSYQRQAIINYFSPAESEADLTAPPSESASYFNSINPVTEERLAHVLENMLFYVIEGVSSTSAVKTSEGLAGWIPAIEVESTLSRRNRYLREFAGDQAAATEAAIQRNQSTIKKLKMMAVGCLPMIGMPTSYSIKLWHQLREIALIAALHGHDLQNKEVKMKILSALVGGNLLKIPAASIDLVARQVVKKILLQIGLQGIASSAVIPAHLIFNYFTDNSAKVSAHAKEFFAGENSLPIYVEDYSNEISAP
ncbi:MAG: dual specificity protein phosphatase family protein [Candidatus Protochlamydia sp.]|nr:dual specificity protein phosphatase family protein [Candidatus Protochlamydia sp.]